MDSTKKGMARRANPDSFSAPQPLVANPVERKEDAPDLTKSSSFLNAVALRFPRLKKTLTQAGMRQSPTRFVQASLSSAAYLAATLLLVTWLLIRENELSLPIAILLIPVYYGISFVYSMHLPQVKAMARARRLEQELVFAGRHMLIELKSGVPLFDAMLGVSRDYGEALRYYDIARANGVEVSVTKAR